MRTVLITAIGSVAADIVIKELHKLGCRVIGTDIYQKEWIADAMNVDSFYQVCRCDEPQKYIEQIIAICKTENVSHIMPLTDLEIDVINSNRGMFECNNLCVCISCKETIDICRNKAKAAEIIGHSTRCKTIPCLGEEEMFDSRLYPIVCKPINGRSSLGIKKFYSVEEARPFWEKCDKNEYIIQPFISGVVVTVDVVRNEKTQSCVVLPRKELLRTLNGLGTTVYVFHDEILEKLCIKMAEALNVNGCVNFEFIEDKNGDRFFLECNPRFSGGVEYSVLSGYNCVSNHFKCFIDEDIDVLEEIQEQYIARKYEEFITKCIK